MIGQPLLVHGHDAILGTYRFRICSDTWVYPGNRYLGVEPGNGVQSPRRRDPANMETTY